MPVLANSLGPWYLCGSECIRIPTEYLSYQKENRNAERQSSSNFGAGFKMSGSAGACGWSAVNELDFGQVSDIEIFATFPSVLQQNYSDDIEGPTKLRNH